MSKIKLSPVRRFLLNGNDFLVVEVPEDSYDFSNAISSNTINYKLDSSPDEEGSRLLMGYWDEDLKILGTLSDLSEEKCAKYVEKIELQKGTTMTDGTVLDKNYVIGYKNYFEGNHYYPHEYFSAKESFISFLQSKKIDISKKLLIVKRMGY